MTDLISRHDAIDAINKLWINGTNLCQADSLMETVKELPSAKQWIPVSERLPKESDYTPFSYYMDGAVLFCTKDGELGFGWYYESTKTWANEDERAVDVIAWMPLPDPWHTEETQNEEREIEK